MWYMFSLTSRRCSCPVLFCVRRSSDWQTGWEREPEPRQDPRLPPSPGRRTPAGRRRPRSPPQTTWRHREHCEDVHPSCIRRDVKQWVQVFIRGAAPLSVYRCRYLSLQVTVSYRKTLIICSQGPSVETAAHRSTTSCTASVLVFLTEEQNN